MRRPWHRRRSRRAPRRSRRSRRPRGGRCVRVSSARSGVPRAHRMTIGRSRLTPAGTSRTTPWAHSARVSWANLSFAGSVDPPSSRSRCDPTSSSSDRRPTPARWAASDSSTVVSRPSTISIRPSASAGSSPLVAAAPGSATTTAPSSCAARRSMYGVYRRFVSPGRSAHAAKAARRSSASQDGEGAAIASRTVSSTVSDSWSSARRAGRGRPARAPAAGRAAGAVNRATLPSPASRDG